MGSPYTISIPSRALDDLRDRLVAARWPDELDDVSWSMGTPLTDMKRLADYWKTDFDWRKAEAKLNDLPNYITDIAVHSFGTLKIHFLHQRSSVSRAIPILFCHGWPGSFLEAEKLLPLLANPVGKEAVAFHVVVPSLPNFGFSEGTNKRGFGIRQYAETCHELMLQLGYERYVTQGGDWGFHITRAMGLLYPESCKASHLNYAECFPPSLLSQPLLWLQDKLSPYSAQEKEGVRQTALHDKNGKGYDILQQTKPQTIGYALSDSPVALLAWIYEKLVGWTDDYQWTDDEVLTWVSIYWFSVAGPAASPRIYYEATHMDESKGDIGYERPLRWIPHVKYGVSVFPKDIFVHPDSWIRTLGDVVLVEREMKGGHFAATECPEAVSGALQKMFRRDGPCYGIVEGCNGYEK